MKRYSEYKDSGVKWIGEIPEHWKIAPFGRHFSYGKGLPITKADLQSEGTPVISYGQIHSKKNTGTKIDENLIRYVHPSYIDTNPQSLLKENDFIFADTSEDIEGCGNCAYNDINGNIFAGYHTVIARPQNILFPKYYAYLFQSKNWKTQIQTLVNGVKVYSINRGILKQSILLIPQKDEQEAIVTYLDTKVAKIDEYISIAEKKIAALEELKQTIIAEAVTRGIHKDVPMKDSGVKWIGMILEHWKIVAIKRFSEIILGKMLDKTNGNEQQYLCAKDVHFDEINLTDLKKMYFSPEEQSKYRVRKGDLLVVEGGACGTCAILRTDVNDIFIQNSIMIVRGDKTKCVNDFIAYSIQALVQKGYTESVCNKATIMHFTKEKLGNTLISLPPLPEQQEIVTYLDSKVANINQLCQAERSQIEKLKEYKQRLISDVVTGKVKVTND